MPRARTDQLLELAAVFLKLGVVSFGGPAAHIALMRRELVERRRWLTTQEFLDLIGAVNLIPGPNSTEMAIHVGRLRAGWPGLIVAGTCFIVPAMAVVGAVAVLYVRSGALPETRAIFYGLQPVVIAVIAVALWQLARTPLRSIWLGLWASRAWLPSALAGMSFWCWR
jgi:chromate transporter